MKKSLLALAALTAFAGAASAQSSVTLFGVVDVNARQVRNDASIKSLSQDGNASSRLGFRGVEDLGGGLRAGFWIEGALNPDTGNATGQTWQRRSTVSLISNLGEIRLGRDYTPIFWNWTVFDVFGTNGVGQSTNLGLEGGQSTGSGGSYGTLVRANNSIGYFLPAMGGLYGQIMVAAGEGTLGNKHYGGRLGYSAGPFNVAGSYGSTEVTNNDDGTAWNFGGSYDFGFAKFMGFYGEVELINTTQKNWNVGAQMPIGAFTLKASYGSVENVFLRQANDAEATQYAFGATYDLSKRTALYANYARISNDNSNFKIGQTVLTMGDKNSTGGEVGIRHSF